MCTNIALLVQNFTYFRVGLKLGRKRPGMVFSRWVLRHESSAHHPLNPVIKLGVCIPKKKERKKHVARTRGWKQKKETKTKRVLKLILATLHAEVDVIGGHAR